MARETEVDLGETGGIGLGLAEGPGPQGWPEVPEDVQELDPIMRLKPNSELHERVKKAILRDLSFSERKMAQFYPRWRDNENRMQAYVVAKGKEERERQRSGGEEAEAPEVYSIVVPYMYSTVSTICTYLMQTFCGRDPIIQLASHKVETLSNAKVAEAVIQYCLHSKDFQRHFWNFLWNGQVYGVAILRSLWLREMKHRTRWIGGERRRGLEKVFEGTETISVDPFNFFPDPTVPMVEVPQRGAFCYWRTFEGKHQLLQAQADGQLQWVEHAAPLKGAEGARGSEESQFSRRAQSSGAPGGDSRHDHNVVQVDQGTKWIIPAELGLGSSEHPQLWMFTILNKSQVVQAEPYEADHGMHPISVSEPYVLGQGFGNLGMADFLGPLQDAMSWLINSHMDSVREILNGTLVVDPSRLEMQDFAKRKKEHGRILRLKSTAIGQDARSAVHQLAVQDVTQSHIQDMRVLQMLGDAISGVNDNLRGLQDAGGRKTATEVRVTGEAGASRLATLAKVISVQAMKGVAEQHIYNMQQYMDEDFYITLTGKEGIEAPLRVFPEMLVGDFHYKSHDGTLPLDKVATVEAWVQIIQLVAGDPELRGRFDFVSLVEHVAELAGARGVGEFRLEVEEMGPGMGPPAGAMPIGGPQSGGQGGGVPGPGAGPGGMSPDDIAAALGASAGRTVGAGMGGPV